MSIVQIGKSIVNAKVVTDDDSVKAIVQAALTYTIPEEARGSGKWDGKSSFFEWPTCKFPAGFTHLVRKELERAGHQVQIVAKPLPEALGVQFPKVSEHPHDPRYDYQPDTVERLLRRGQMIAQVATGGGKSEIANLATARIKRKTLFLTTRKVLMYQMRKAFTKAMRLRALNGERDLVGQKIGVVGDGLWRPGNEADLINVGMVQTIASRLKSGDKAEVQETLDFLAGIEFVILEEAHEAASDSFYEVMRRCTSAAYRLALTATPFMKDNEEDNMRLMACTGAIGIHITEKELIDKGILAEPFFVTIKTDYEPDGEALERSAAKAKAKANNMLSTRLGWTTDFQRATSLGIVHNKARNRAIVNQCLLGKKHGLPVIVLVMAKKHGHILEWDMQAAGLRTEYIQGEDDQENREKALEALGKNEIDVLIGTTIIDVGVDVPAVGMVILAGGGKAETTLRQRIGRGLRAKKKGSNVCVIVDFEDKVNKHLYKHYQTRRQIIEGTPGFFERLLTPGSQFPFQRYFPVLTSAA